MFLFVMEYSYAVRDQYNVCSMFAGGWFGVVVTALVASTFCETKSEQTLAQRLYNDVKSSRTCN